MLEWRGNICYSKNEIQFWCASFLSMHDTHIYISNICMHICKIVHVNFYFHTIWEISNFHSTIYQKGLNLNDSLNWYWLSLEFESFLFGFPTLVNRFNHAMKSDRANFEYFEIFFMQHAVLHIVACCLH